MAKANAAADDSPRCGNCPCWMRQSAAEGECTKDPPAATLLKGVHPITGQPNVHTMTGFPIMPPEHPGCWQHPARAALYMQLVAQEMRQQQIAAAAAAGAAANEQATA